MRSAAGLLVTLIVVSLLGGQGSAAPVEPEIAYTDFKALVEQVKVEEIVLQGGEMAGKLRAPVPLGPRGEPAARFRTRIPGFGDADLLPALQWQAVRLRVLEPADGWARALGWGIPVVLLLWIFALSSRSDARRHLQLPEHEGYTLPEQYLKDRPTVMLGGRAAEKQLLGSVSSGADEQTLDGPVNFLGRRLEAEGRARQVVNSRRELLVRLATRLEEDETLEREQIESCLGPRPLDIALEAAG